MWLLQRNYDVTKSSKTKGWTYNMTCQCNQMNRRLSIVDHSDSSRYCLLGNKRIWHESFSADICIVYVKSLLTNSVAIKFLNSKKNQKAKLDFAHEHISWVYKIWTRIFFSVKFNLLGINSKLSMWEIMSQIDFFFFFLNPLNLDDVMYWCGYVLWCWHWFTHSVTWGNLKYYWTCFFSGNFFFFFLQKC